MDVDNRQWMEECFKQFESANRSGVTLLVVRQNVTEVDSDAISGVVVTNAKDPAMIDALGKALGSCEATDD